jgi:hypothetical protein
MKTKYPVWLLFLIILLNFSCTTDFKYELPKLDPVPAVIASNDPDNYFRLRVTIAKGFQDSVHNVNADFHVRLFEDGKQFTELREDTTYNYLNHWNKYPGYRERIFIKDSEVNFMEGKEYRVEVTNPQYPLVSAKTSVPVPVKIKSITWERVDVSMPRWYGQFIVEVLGDFQYLNCTPPLIEWTITFDDPPGLNNYYRIGVNYRYMFHWQGLTSTVDGKLQYAPSNSNDPVFMYVIFTSPNPYPRFDGYRSPDQLAKEILFNDYNFNGKEYSIKILTPRPSEIQRGSYQVYNTDFKFVINLYSLSEDYYKYWLDRYKIEKLSGDPFSEPVRIHTNVSNGAGIFAFSSLDSDTVQMDINY